MMIKAIFVITAVISATYAGGEREFAHPHRLFAHYPGASHDERDIWFGGSLSRLPWRQLHQHRHHDDSSDGSHEHLHAGSLLRRHARFDCGNPGFRVFMFGNRRSFCCGGLFYEDVAQSLNCCGLNIYDTRLYSCNGGATVVPMFRPSYEVDHRSIASGRYGSGNARIAFDQNEAPAKCGTIFLHSKSPYDLCCDGHHFPNPHLYYSCCGNRCFDSRYYRCSPQREIVLIDEFDHHHHHHPALMAHHWGLPYVGALPPVHQVPPPQPVHIHPGKEIHSAEIISPHSKENKTEAEFEADDSHQQHSHEKFAAVHPFMFHPSLAAAGKMPLPIPAPVQGYRHFYPGPPPPLAHHHHQQQQQQPIFDMNGAGPLVHHQMLPPAPHFQVEPLAQKAPFADRFEAEAVPAPPFHHTSSQLHQKIPMFHDRFAQSIIEGFVPHILTSIQDDVRKGPHHKP